MAKKDSFHKTSTIVPPEFGAPEVPYYQKQDFDDSVFTKGYDCYIEKAVKCACVLNANSQALPDCQNCGSIGWVFVNKRLTKGFTVSMSHITKYLNWSETDRGTISLTVRDKDKLGFMDRFTNLNLVSTYSEALYVRKMKGRLAAYTIYPPIQITEIYFFLKSDKQLKQLQLNTDYTIQDNAIILNDSFNDYNLEEIVVSVRYTHFPQFHVLDITREAIANLNSAKECGNLDFNHQYFPLPIHAVARKAHYMFDAPNILGDSLFDNTFDYSGNSNLTGDSLPFSLDFWITRSSAQDIVASLKKEANSLKMTLIKSLLP